MRLLDRVFNGADTIYEQTVKAVDEAIAKYGADKAVSLPDTAFALPCYYAVTGIKVTTLGEMKEACEFLKNSNTRNQRLADGFTSGIATAIGAEFTETIKYIEGNPYEDPIVAHFSDAMVRELGLPLVTEDIPGVAVFIGEAPSTQELCDLIKQYQSQGIFVALVGKCIDQAVEGNAKLGFNVRCTPLGYHIESVVHIVSVALRAGLIFGNITPGHNEELKAYTMKRVKAFVNAYAPVDDVTVAFGAGAIAYGFPVISNDTNDLKPVPKSIVIQPDTLKFNATSIEARDVRVKISNVDIPVPYGSAFEGEIIRKGDMKIEADGSRMDCFELVQSKPLAEVEDHKIEVFGDDFDKYEDGTKISMAIIAEVAGKNMQTDFESVMERKFHAFINCAEGIMHTGQRDMIRIRVSKDAFNEGFRAKHFGEILYAKLKSEYDAVVDKCQIKIYIGEETTKLRNELATPTFDKRDERLGSLTDESVDEFYTCILCQAFSPSHVCIVTPERLGLCGAVSWLDAKATHELDPNGPCQIVKKDHVIDERVGRIEEVNEAVKKYSQGALEEVTLYSIMEDPMTSCGCFECICGIEPMSNGVVIVNREHTGVTPVGMTFSELAAMTGGGVQTPGFMGHGKHFIASKKFMKAEGGIQRIVWLPKALKEQVAEKLNATAKELYGIDNFTDMIADETVVEGDPEALMNFLTEKGHPALSMDPMM